MKVKKNDRIEPKPDDALAECNGMTKADKCEEDTVQLCLLIDQLGAAKRERDEAVAEITRLKEHVQALAAEVAAVRWAAGQVYSAAYNQGYSDTAHGLPCVDDSELKSRGAEVLEEFIDPEHSGIATDAILNEVQAQAAEGFVAYCGTENSVFVKTKGYYRSLEDAVDEYADRIRGGGAQP